MVEVDVLDEDCGHSCVFTIEAVGRLAEGCSWYGGGGSMLLRV